MSRHKSKAIPGRNLRLADQIQKDLAGIIQREIDTTRAGLITLSGVELSTDYAHAKVYFTVLGAEPDQDWSSGSSGTPECGPGRFARSMRIDISIPRAICSSWKKRKVGTV